MVIILKMSTACNGTCVYCSAYQDKPQHLSLRVAERVLGLAAEFLRANAREGVNIILHGGEPLLQTRRFYEQFNALIDQQLGPLRERLSVSMQSNLTLLTPAKAQTLKSVLTRPIGTSYDIYPGVRGIRGRVSLDERWYHAQRVAREAELDTGLVYVVHKKTVQNVERVWTFFTNHPYVTTVRFNPLYAEGLGKTDDVQNLSITPAEWGQFLIEGWRLYARDGFRASFAPFNELRSAHLRRDPENMSCAHKGHCADSHMGVDPDGSIYNCGRWSDTKEFSFGTVFETDRQGLLESPVRLRLGERQKILFEGPCKGCDWWAYCHGGCPNDAYLEHGTVEARTKWCEGYLAFFEECLRPLGEPLPPQEER